MKDQRQFFDELITEDWESYKSDAWDFSRRSEIASLFRRMKPERILDIGCGCGFHDAEMAGYDFVRQVDAIDYSSQSIRKANEAYPHPKVSRRVADLESDDPGPVYDLVVSFQVLEHLFDPDVYFAYCLRACKPGGLVAVATPNVDRLDNRIRRWRGEPPALVDPQHFREYSRAELIGMGRRFGLIEQYSLGVGLQSLIYPNLLGGSLQRAERWGRRLPALANVMIVVFRKQSTT